MIKSKKLLLVSLIVGLMLTGCTGMKEKAVKPAEKAPVAVQETKEIEEVVMNSEEATKDLFSATGKNNIAGIKQAIKEGADINAFSTGLTPIMKVLAKRKINLNVLKTLLDAKPDFTIENSNNATILMQATSAETVKLILDAGMDVNAKNSIRTTALINAATKLSPEVVKALVDGGANLEELDARDRSALVWAVLENRLDIIGILLESGANVNAKDSNGNTPLMWASEEVVINMILDGGADLTVVNNNGLLIVNETVMLSIEVGYDSSLNKLISMGVNMNFVDSFGETPLTFAVKRGNPLIVSLLLTADVDRTIKNKNGKTALDLAMESKNQALIDILSK